MSKAIEDRMKEAHRLLANAAGRMSGMIARKRINRGDLAHAALFARSATVALDALRDDLPPPKGETFECPTCKAPGATKDGCAICGAGPNG